MPLGRRLAVFGLSLTAGVVLVTGCGTLHRPAADHGTVSSGSTAAGAGSGPTNQGGPNPSGEEANSAIGPVVAAETVVATVTPAGAPGSRTPGGQPTVHVPGQWFRAASVLPVVGQQPGWVEVRLAQRPNESTAWVPVNDVSLATDPYHIVVDLGTRHLRLFNEGREVANFPAGIGIPADPTPTGQFFVALFARPPSPGYGQFVIVTSAHSNAISDWEQSGDAITAIHGPLGSDKAIGTTGARVSHGCVRLHNSDLAQLRDVPAGTPVDIVD
jgi:lipoprotein-anchoring transpeptidase ErfK/SrfK